MKRKDILRIIKANGAKFSRRGGDHDIWKKGNKSFPVPHHCKIGEGLAKEIIKQSKG